MKKLRLRKFLLLFLFHHNTFLLHAIDFDNERLVEMNVTDMGGFTGGWHLIENVLPIDAIAHEVVDGEVTYAEGSEVLEEVGALTWIHTVVG